MASWFYAHLLSSLLRASSFFYAHLQHDQDFPSDTRPRDDLAPRLAPGHVLAAHPLELHLTINKLPMAAPVVASSNFHTSHMVIRIIHTYHCRVQYFSLDPWGIVTSAGGYIHWRRSSHLNSTSPHHKLAVSPIQPPDISQNELQCHCGLRCHPRSLLDARIQLFPWYHWRSLMPPVTCTSFPDNS